MGRTYLKTCQMCESKYISTSSKNKFCKLSCQTKSKNKTVNSDVGRDPVSWLLYEKLVKEHDNCCAICKTDKPGHSRLKKWSIDHDHKTGAIRGILCIHCNAALGFLRDDEKIALAAAEYLLKYKQV